MKVITNELVPVYETDSGEKVVDGRELHEFLEVGKDFTTWMKDRIEKFGFTEGEDFSPQLGKTSDQGGRPKTEYIMKLDMAKEIAMLEGNEKGKKVRKYFIAIETKARQTQSINVELLTPEMQMFKHMFDAVAKTQIESAETKHKLVLVENNINTIRETIIQREDNWRDSLGKMFNSAVRNSNGKDHKTMRNESYVILEERGHCDLARRQRNMQDRLKESGATKTKVDNVSKLDVIEDDPRLKEIYTSIVKEMSIKNMKMNA